MKQVEMLQEKFAWATRENVFYGAISRHCLCTNLYTVLWVKLQTLKIEPRIEPWSLLPLYQQSNEARQIIGMEFKVP